MVKCPSVLSNKAKQPVTPAESKYFFRLLSSVMLLDEQDKKTRGAKTRMSKNFNMKKFLQSNEGLVRYSHSKPGHPLIYSPHRDIGT
jgi:hypothetical protein